MKLFTATFYGYAENFLDSFDLNSTNKSEAREEIKEIFNLNPEINTAEVLQITQPLDGEVSPKDINLAFKYTRSEQTSLI